MRSSGRDLPISTNEPSTASLIVEASALSFRHEGANHDVLKNVDLSLPRGSLTCLVGVNGSGKSTLLTLLAGIFAPTGGLLTISGFALPKDAKSFRGHAALVPQDPDLFILGSLVEEDLLLSIPPHDEEARNKALELAREFGLSDRLQEPVHILSYGQKRKLCLASALAGTSERQLELLLLDEPFAGLDHPAALAMRSLLNKNKNDGLSQIVVTHDLDLIADLADQFIVLQDGHLVANGIAETVFPQLLPLGVRPPSWWLAGESAPSWLKQE